MAIFQTKRPIIGPIIEKTLLFLTLNYMCIFTGQVACHDRASESPQCQVVAHLVQDDPIKGESGIICSEKFYIMSILF